jgi:ribosomal protein L11 methyltransferase
LSENPGIVPELLCALELQYSSWQDRELKLSYHMVYCETETEAQNVKKKIDAMLPDWSGFGVNVKDVETLTVRREDWSEVWKKYFHVIEISDRLIVKPSWREHNATPGQVIVEIDPGMSFGTGQHATTSFCLKMIDKLADVGCMSFLDAGCGSGILSIAAAKLGYKPICAFDIDPDAIRVSHENFELNHIADGTICTQVSDLTGFAASSTDQYELVAANILGHVLLQNREIINSFVKPGGYLILAGILNGEFCDISAGFCELGLEMLESFTEKEWTSGLFKKA